MNSIARLLAGLTNFFLALVMGFLGLRFVLRLFAANPVNDFVNFIYRTSNELLAPFRGIFPTRVIDGAYAVEFSTLFAMIVYALIGYLVLALINSLTADSSAKVVQRTTRKK